VFGGGPGIFESQFGATCDPEGFGACGLLVENLLGGFECCGIFAAAQLLVGCAEQFFCGGGAESENGCDQ
jgi:hypothetical protein